MRLAPVLLLTAACAAGAPSGSPQPAQSVPGRVGSHGMVLAGAPGAAFLSHIPMFGPPHDVQVLAAGTLEGAALPNTFGDRTYTFVPDRMSLDAFRSGSLRAVPGKVYLGNFEQGGRPVGAATFKVARVLHEHLLQPQAAPAAPRYFVFGSRASTYVAHRITRSPGFDEIVAVTLSGAQIPTDEALANGVEVEVEGPDTVEARLATTGEKRARSGAFTIAAKTELSCLVGPEFAQPCPN